MNQYLMSLWNQGEAHFKQKNWDAARACYQGIIELQPKDVPSLLRLSLVQSRLGFYRQARDTALAANACEPTDPMMVLDLGARLRNFNESEALIQCLGRPQVRPRCSAQTLAEMAAMLTAVGAHEQAVELLDLSLARDPRNPSAHYLRGNLHMFFGETELAEQRLERCIELAPYYAQAHWVLSRLRRNTAESNHVARIEKQLAQTDPGTQGEVFLAFALHNELHDLKRYDAAWVALERGCRTKRRLIQYDHAQSQVLFGQLEELCTPEFFQSPPVAVQGGTTPIFVVGMHRSGTTLLEQILGGHSQIADGGETYAFTAQMKLATGHACKGVLDNETVALAGAADYRAVGEGYLAANAWRARGRPYLTDKLPSNFLNIGFIAKALPQAKILHMVRDPMDTCFSNLRVQFSEACGFSYDQDELADFFIAYRQLMAHWHKVLPGRVLDIAYSDLVNDPEASVRRAMDFCGLPFEPQTLAIEQKSGAVATASTAQVRQGIKKSGFSVWSHYERYLAPLRTRLVVLDDTH